MAFTSTSFPAELVKEVFTGAQGHSAIAKLAGSTPVAFSGTDIMTFSLTGEVNLVGEGEARVLTLTKTRSFIWFPLRSNTAHAFLTSS